MQKGEAKKLNFTKIKVDKPVVELDGSSVFPCLRSDSCCCTSGDEMTRVIWKMIRETVSSLRAFSEQLKLGRASVFHS